MAIEHTDKLPTPKTITCIEYFLTLQVLAAKVERIAPQLRPRALVIVLQAFSQYNLAVPGLAMALADTAERQLHTLT